MSRSFRSAFKTLLFMATASVICISLITFVYAATRERITRNTNLHKRRAVLESAGLNAGISPQEMQKIFNSRVEYQPAHDLYLIRSAPDGELTGYVVPQSAPGLWGRISAVVAIKPDRRTVYGIAFTEQNETPGLGGKIVSDPSFAAQFASGRIAPFSLRPSSKSGERAHTKVDGITGATITSTAVVQILNKAVQKLQEGER